MRTLVWFRGKDLRVADHAPLASAAQSGEVVPLFVIDPFFFSEERAPSFPHRMQFLLESLAELCTAVARLGSRLLLVPGKSAEVVPRLAAALRVDRVVAHRWTEPFGRKRDALVAKALAVPFDLYEGETLATAGTLRNETGRPYAVFSAFERAFHRKVEVSPPLPAPSRLPPLPADVRPGEAPLPTLESLGLSRNPRVLHGGELAASERLRLFLAGAGARYAEDRDRIDRDGTSRLSADLKFGTLSVRTVWARASEVLAAHPKSLDKFLSELVWREFTHATLWERPELLTKPFRPEFDGFPWRSDEAGWHAWTAGTTGYPVVDAAARQLLGEGFVHNRARMIAASFLTKHLVIDYRRGEAHYMTYLTDGDWAQNNAGWQWSAGSGTDAVPYFRVFNPITQGEKFDPDGAYVRKWVPELRALPKKWIHKPFEAPDEVLAQAGVRLGSTYPAPIVDAAYGRSRYLHLAEQHFGRGR